MSGLVLAISFLIFGAALGLFMRMVVRLLVYSGKNSMTGDNTSPAEWR